MLFDISVDEDDVVREWTDEFGYHYAVTGAALRRRAWIDRQIQRELPWWRRRGARAREAAEDEVVDRVRGAQLQRQRAASLRAEQMASPAVARSGERGAE